MRNAVVILFTVLLSGAAWSQSVEAPLAFEVASIKQSPSSDLRGMTVGCPADPGRITCTNVNLVYLVTMAYGIQRYQLSGLTPSPNMERYEIAVKLPEGTTRDQIGRMWQKLLADRFKLAIHRETKEAQVYELVVAKGGLKMKEWVEPPPAGEDAAPAPKADSGPGSRPKLDKDGYPELGPTTSMAIMGSKARWHAVKATTAMIASMLAAQTGQPVNDVTGLTGKYEFTLSWFTGSGGGRGAAIASQPEGGSPLAGMNETDEGPSLIMAIQSQLGLKLEQKKGTIEMLVVDHVERAPTEN
jgi:uncharacterized protein (TIGR03435 family)